MFNYIKSMFAKDELVKVATKKRTTETRGRKSLSKKQKVINLLSKGQIQKLYGTPFKYDNHVVRMPKKSELASIDA